MEEKMTRFLESFGLFGDNVGSGTVDPFTCEWCGKHYKETSGKTAPLVDTFGDKQIGECCFEKIEDAVTKHLPAILVWEIRRLKIQGLNIEKRQELLDSLGKTLNSVS